MNEPRSSIPKVGSVDGDSSSATLRSQEKKRASTAILCPVDFAFSSGSLTCPRSHWRFASSLPWTRRSVSPRCMAHHASCCRWHAHEYRSKTTGCWTTIIAQAYSAQLHSSYHYRAR